GAPAPQRPATARPRLRHNPRRRRGICNRGCEAAAERIGRQLQASYCVLRSGQAGESAVFLTRISVFSVNYLFDGKLLILGKSVIRHTHVPFLPGLTNGGALLAASTGLPCAASARRSCC